MNANVIALLASTLLLAGAAPEAMPRTAPGGLHELPAASAAAAGADDRANMHAGDASPARDGQSVPARAAHHILERIEALSGRYPQLAAIKSTARKSESIRPFWIAYHYAHGVSSGPNPDYQPGKKSAPVIRIFSPADGIDLNLYFYEGQWPGQAMVSPVAIGTIKVAVFIDGPQSDALTSLREDVSQIIEDERRAYRSAAAQPED